MSDHLGDEISRLAREFDPHFEQEGHDIGRILQGALYITTHLASRGQTPAGHLHEIIDIDYVDQQVDNQGVYKNFFTVVTKAGHKIRVTVEPE